MKIEEFEQALSRQRCLQNAVRARQLTASLERHRGHPTYWAEDVERALHLAAAAARETRLPVADDLPAALPEPERRLLARGLVRSYGALLCAWPELLEDVRALRAAGVRLTEPV